MRRRSSTLPILVALALATAALVLWDRAPGRGGAPGSGLVPGAALSRRVALEQAGRTLRLERRGTDWLTDGGELANGAAVDALLAELELGEVLGPAKIVERRRLATIELGAPEARQQVIVYGAAIDGQYVERCDARGCTALVTRARLVPLLQPDGGWLSPVDLRARD